MPSAAEAPAAERDRQRDPPGRRPLAPPGLPAHHLDHARPPRPLARRGPRAPPLLLPARGRRDRDLPDRGGREARRHQGAQRDPPGERPPQRRPAAVRVQDGHRLRQDRPDGHAHRLAGAQQGREPAGPPVQRQVPRRHARHHDPRPPPRAPPERHGQLLPRDGHRHPRAARPAPGGDRPRHQLPRVPAPRQDPGRVADQEGPVARRSRRRALPRDPARDGPPGPPRLRQREEHRRPQRRGASLLRTRPERGGGRGRTRRRRANPGEEGPRGGPRLAERRPGGPRQARRPRGLRPLRHAVLPQGLRLRGGHALPVGHQRLRPHGRDRVRHRQDPARARERRLDDRDRPDVPRPLAPRPRRAPAQGHQGHADRRPAGDPQGARRRPALALRRLRAEPPGLGGRRHGHAARLHHRLLEHGDLQARLRLDRRLGKGTA